MNLAVKQRMVNNYFRLMQNWDVDAKQEMITKLNQSLEVNQADRFDFSSCFGAWDDARSAQDIFDDLRADRVNNNEIEEF